MVDTYTTSRYESYRPDPDVVWKGRRSSVINLYRKKPLARACSGFGFLGFQKNTIKQYRPEQNISFLQPTIPQFSGKVNPAEVRQVDLCLYESNTVEPVVLETMRADSNGDFACEGWYRVEPTGQYFFRIAGDSNYSTKDFPVQAPIANEFLATYGQFADTAANLQQTYVVDTFTDVQATSLASHTPDTDDVGGGWTVTAGDIKCGEHVTPGLGNFVAYTTQTSVQYGHIQTNDADVLMDCMLVFGGKDDQHGLILRYTDDDNFLRIVIENANTTRPELKIISKVATVDTTLWSLGFVEGSGPYAADTYYRLSVIARGDRIAVDFYPLTYPTKTAYFPHMIHADIQTTDHQTATRHGIYVGRDTMYVDDLKIWSI